MTMPVAATVGKDGRTYLFILPISSRETKGDGRVAEILQIACKRAALVLGMCMWVLLDECKHTTFWKRLSTLIQRDGEDRSARCLTNGNLARSL